MLLVMVAINKTVDYFIGKSYLIIYYILL